MALRVHPASVPSCLSISRRLFLSIPLYHQISLSTAQMVTRAVATNRAKVIDSHLHIWASPEEAADKYPYAISEEPTLPGHVDFLLQCMTEAGVDGALIVQPFYHKFDHSYVTSVLKQYPSKFVGCCLANPAEDGSGVKQLEDLILKDGYRAVRFNPYLWPSGQKMTNEVGKSLFSKAGELGVPVGFMCMKGLNLHLSEITELCEEFPSTVVLLDHLAFCKPPLDEAESYNFSELLKLSRFPQIGRRRRRHYRQPLADRTPTPPTSREDRTPPPPAKSRSNAIAAFTHEQIESRRRRCLHPRADRKPTPSPPSPTSKLKVAAAAATGVSRKPYPYEDLSQLLSQVVSSFGANRVMWGSDFPYVVAECGYKEAKEGVSAIANEVHLSSTDQEWILGKTLLQLFQGQWVS